MAGEGNRIIDLVKYAESLGIDVNIGKNQANGNKGFFKVKGSKCRIDISKTLSEKEKLSVLIHEITHYIHHKYDKSLKSLNFIFKDFTEDYEAEMIELTVDSVPKNLASNLFNEKAALKNEIELIKKNIKAVYPQLKLSNKNNFIEKEISKYEYKYLLNHDTVRVYGLFSSKLYSIKSIKKDFPYIKPIYVDYIKLNSAKRKMKRINNKISRLNKYYNSTSELLARSFEYYITNPDIMCIKSPLVKNHYDKIIKENLIPEFTRLTEICY